MFLSAVSANFPATLLLPLRDPVYILGVLLVVLLVTPWISLRLRVPTLIVLMGLGCLLGSNLLGVLERDAQMILLEKMGLLYIMLIAGLQMDLSNLRQLGARSLLFGLLTFGIPFGIGVISAQILGLGLLASALVGILYSPHTLIAYPIMARLGIAQHEAVGVAVGGSVVTSVLTLVGLSIVQALAQGALTLTFILKLAIGFPVFVGLCFWLIPQGMQRLLQKVPEASPIAFLLVLSTLFVTAALTQLLGIDAIVGAFIAGLALNRQVPRTGSLMYQIEFIGNCLFIPLFLVSVGILANPTIFFSAPENIGTVALVVIGAMGGKWLAAGLAGWRFQYSAVAITTMFSLTCSRAALVLVIALYGREAQLIGPGLFNAVIAYIAITCLVGPLIAEACGQRLSRLPVATEG
ncbi:cation:proton antiporter [Synechococcales cyanobacterium C]|uniref:Cation:proton antiporter n=1 Tax=Petrachloros mirabilis ULC683 TaxID=2781853 RepID=A0A8K2A8C6_9CYAN|nr:cation:proton antiporter [Petrachloros mirabilis]NCJ07866.1 cation:proton antiporter [Petrachloros mirabilis ULC683]